MKDMAERTGNSNVASSVAVAVALAVAATAAAYCSAEKKRANCKVPPGRTAVRLMPEERSPAMMDQAPISTITFFCGNFDQALRFLSHRFDDILATNPWISSRLVGDDLTHDESPRLKDYFTASDVPIPRDLSYKEIGLIVSEAGLLCTKGSVARDDRSVPLFKVSLHRSDQDDDDVGSSFCLVMSMCHVLGDGNTFFLLHNMLCSDSPIVALNAARKTLAFEQMTEAMGGPNQLFMNNLNAGSIFNFISGALLSKVIGPPSVCEAYYISESFIASEKAKIKPPDFVSTNDIIVSTYFKATSCDTGIMAVNGRGRVSDCTTGDAGNYANILWYRPPDFGSPSLIRSSVKTWKRAAVPETEAPGTWESIGSCSAIITNQTSYMKEPILPGSKADLHIPLFDLKSPRPSRITVYAVVFKSDNGRTAIIMEGSQDRINQVVLSGLLGEKVVPTVSRD